MPKEDFLPRKVIVRGREMRRIRPPDLKSRLTEVDCGCWAPLGIDQVDTVVRRAALKGFSLTVEDALELSTDSEGSGPNLPLTSKVFAKAVRWVNENAPTGYHLGMKLTDIWFMPDVWWEDTAGDELSLNDSGIEGDWALADVDGECTDAPREP